MSAATAHQDLVGKGLYSYSRAAALVGTSPQAIRRWLVGYRAGFRDHRSVVPLELAPIGGEVSVSFLNLVEVRLITLLRQKGVSLHRIRQAAQLLTSEYDVRQPLAWSGLRTDGRDVFLNLGEDCIQASGKQRGACVMEKVLDQYLESLEFADDGLARRWYPDAGDGHVMLDPLFLFGEPALDGTRLSTRILADHVAAGDSPEVVADWYGIAVDRVLTAERFEKSLSTAA